MARTAHSLVHWLRGFENTTRAVTSGTLGDGSPLVVHPFCLSLSQEAIYIYISLTLAAWVST